MPTLFPGAVDTFPTAVDLSNDTLATKPHSTLHGNLGDALLAVETYLLAPLTVHEPFVVQDADDDSIVIQAIEDTGVHYFQGRNADGATWEFNTTLGTLAIRDPLSSRSVDLGSNEIALTDASAVVRVRLADDGTALTIQDDAGNPRIVTSDIGDGIWIKDATGQARVIVSEFADNSTPGVVVKSATDVIRLAMTEDLEGLNGGFGVYDAAGDPSLFMAVDTGFLAGDPAGASFAQLSHDPGDGGALSLNDEAGGIVHYLIGGEAGAVDALAGFFAATPYGQDAYLAPLDETVTILVLGDLAALLNEERVRINAINQYLIDRGWEAAA